LVTVITDWARVVVTVVGGSGGGVGSGGGGGWAGAAGGAGELGAGGGLLGLETWCGVASRRVRTGVGGTGGFVGGGGRKEMLVAMAVGARVLARMRRWWW
jgi:hypothetical protein